MSEKDKPKKHYFNYQLLYRRTALIIYDILSVVAASFLALLLRYDMHVDDIPDEFILPVRNFLPVNIVLTLVIFYLFRLYHSLWAFAGENEMQNLVIACFLSAIVSGIGLNLFKISSQPVPDSYYFMYLFLLVTFVFISRFSYRFVRGRKHRMQNRKNNISVMIIGAGEAGNALIKEIVSSNYSTMVIRCIIDDDKQKWGQFIQGIKVVGGRDKIIESADLYDIDEIFIAIPSAPRAVIRDILDICKETSCKLRSLPGMYQLVNGEVSVSKLRDVEVEDLLGRDDVQSAIFTADSSKVFSDAISNINNVVVVIIVCAGALAFIVLYNLTNINITERIREIATIKVLGFYPMEVASYVFRENFFLTAIGGGVGLLLGKLLHWFVMEQINIDMVCFQAVVQPVSYLYSFALTFLFACIVNAAMFGKLDDINMAESLKSIE